VVGEAASADRTGVGDAAPVDDAAEQLDSAAITHRDTAEMIDSLAGR
jgi:hypothetical protein